MASDSFVVFTEHWNGMALLTREQKGDLLQALMAMHGACEMPELDQATSIVLAMMRPRMEANRKKYEETVAKRKASGSMGGRPSKKQTVSEETMPVQEQPQGSNENHLVSEETIRFSEKPNGFEKNPVSGSDPVYVNTTYSDHTPKPPQGGTDAAASESDCVQEQTLTQTQSESLPGCETEDERTRQYAANRKRIAERQDDFETWWARYPRKVDKKKALALWARLARSGGLPDLQVLLGALAWQTRTQQWQDQRYIPHPTTYLNGSRWQDEPPRIQPQFRPGGPAPSRPCPRSDEVIDVVEHNKAVAAQIFAELTGQTMQDQEKPHDEYTDSGNRPQALGFAGDGGQLRQEVRDGSFALLDAPAADVQC